MRPIESPHNPHLRRLRALHTRKGRQEQGRFLLEGLLLAEEALAAGLKPEEAFLCPALLGGEKTERALAALSAETDTWQLPEALFRLAADTTTPQGIILVAPRREQPLSALDVPAEAPVLAAWEVRDPGNLGTMIRTAHAAGAAAVVTVGEATDPFAGKVARSSMGSLFRVPLAHAARAEEFTSWAAASGLAVAALTAQGGSAHYDVTYPPRTAFVVGNEVRGLPSELREGAWREITIPMPGGAESLNAAVSAAVVLFEFARQSALRHRAEAASAVTGDEGEE